MDGIEYKGSLPQAGTTLSLVQSDFRQVLKSYRRAYRAVVDCGNMKIREHCDLAVSTLDNLLSEPIQVVPEPAHHLPVTRFLDPCLRIAAQGPYSGLAGDVSEITSYLHWQWGYAAMPTHLEDAFAYTDIVGPNAPITSNNLAIGLVLFGSGCEYPPHDHPEITESYLVLSGNVSQNDFGVFGPGSLIFNPPGREHTITVDTMAPALLAYAWTAAPGILATNEMILALD
ncbi:MAG: dimethylsulfonioproprionate lyase family protein [Pseudomonadota bacterium]